MKIEGSLSAVFANSRTKKMINNDYELGY